MENRLVRADEFAVLAKALLVLMFAVYGWLMDGSMTTVYEVFENP